MDKDKSEGMKIVMELNRRGVNAHLASREDFNRLPDGVGAVVLPGSYLGNGVTCALSECRKRNPGLRIIAHFGLEPSETATMVVSRMSA